MYEKSRQHCKGSADPSCAGALRSRGSTGGAPSQKCGWRTLPRENNDYERNIQVADLNALNAILAVMKWKKLCGFYHDFVQEHDSTYTVNSHLLTRDEQQDLT
jgi:hypothetical protein